MSRTIRVITLLALALLVTACASKPNIQTDYDHSIDFSAYKTYGFFSPLGIENPNYSTIYGSVFREAISREMSSRGYQQSETPDLLINVSARIQDKTKVSTYSDPMYGGYYGYRAGMYQPWGGYGYGTTTHVSQYTEGTVNVDMVDAKLKRMVWEAVFIGRLKENRSNAQVREAINTGINQMFTGYPFRAGQ